jgi:hypothetical protein
LKQHQTDKRREEYVCTYCKKDCIGKKSPRSKQEQETCLWLFNFHKKELALQRKKEDYRCYSKEALDWALKNKLEYNGNLDHLIGAYKKKVVNAWMYQPDDTQEEVMMRERAYQKHAMKMR